MIADWWKGHGWPPIEYDKLPKIGIIVENNKNPLVAGFLYMTDTNMCMPHWIVANPEISLKELKPAMKTLFDAFEREALRADKPILWTSCGTRSVIAQFKRAGYNVGDSTAVHLLMDLRPNRYNGGNYGN